MTNFFCVAVKEREVIREMFFKKEEALEFFEQSFREEILAHQQERERKIRRTLSHYENKLRELVLNKAPDKDLQHTCSLKTEKEKELQRLTAEIEAKLSYYLWQTENLSAAISKKPDFELIRICGIRKLTANRFEVTDRRYIAYTALVENMPTPEAALQNLPEELCGKRLAAQATPESNKIARTSKFISQVKQQIKAELRRTKNLLINAA